MGFVQSHYVYSLFTQKKERELVIVLVYVDDLLLTGSYFALIQQVRKDLQSKFKMKDLGELKYFLEFDRAVNNKTNANDHQLEDKGGYQRIVSRLLYLTMIRPDIIFVVKVLSQYMHALKQSHLEAAMRVVRYIKNAPGLGLIVPTDNTLKIAAYCDSDWRACVETRKSITGYAIKFGDALISWKSKKQETMSRSSAEAEFRSMAANVAKIIWMIGLFKELGSEVHVPVRLFLTVKLLFRLQLILSFIKEQNI
uniref:Uncharacterized mitochondrial protein AtMg00810-like n=1 Tax=Nicotiana tabacum TaxID=4097 RepID=A0A1S3ZW87_TOBAC|nr:PREDICTED: uncharacterized mitochondrial protein AtMg00810-like [Nicotiana tabacum]